MQSVNLLAVLLSEGKKSTIVKKQAVDKKQPRRYRLPANCRILSLTALIRAQTYHEAYPPLQRKAQAARNVPRIRAFADVTPGTSQNVNGGDNGDAASVARGPASPSSVMKRGVVTSSTTSKRRVTPILQQKKMAQSQAWPPKQNSPVVFIDSGKLDSNVTHKHELIRLAGAL